MIGLSSAFLARVVAPHTTFATLTSLQIVVDFARPSAAEAATADIADLLEDVTPLLAAGFLQQGQETTPYDIDITLDQRPGGYVVSVAQMVDHAALIWFLLGVIEATNTTPDGAFDRLVRLLDGDIKAARDAFSPKQIDDIARVTLRIEGHGSTRPLDLSDMPVLPQVLALAGRIDAHGADVEFALPVDACWSEDIEHGVLTAQNLGLFRIPDQAFSSEEPALFLTSARHLVVHGWRDSALGLAALVHLLTAGRLTDVDVSNAG